MKRDLKLAYEILKWYSEKHSPTPVGNGMVRPVSCKIEGYDKKLVDEYKKMLTDSLFIVDQKLTWTGLGLLDELSQEFGESDD